MRKIFYALATMLVCCSFSADAAWYACGAFQGWSPSQAQEFVKGSDGLYTLEIDFSAGTNFKISSERPDASMSSSEQWKQFDSGSIKPAGSPRLNKGIEYTSGVDNIEAPSAGVLTVVINEQLSKMAFSDGTVAIDWGIVTDTYELTAYLRVSDWEKPCVWVWNNDPVISLYSQFPGKEMELIEPGLYRWTETAPRIPDQILFSDNGSKTKRSREPEFVNGMIWDAEGNIISPISDNPGTPTPQSPLGAVTAWTATEHGLTAQCNQGTLDITYFGDGVVKVISRPTGVTTPERTSISVVGTPAGSVSITETESEVKLETTQVITTLNKSTSLITFADATTGDTYLSEKKGIVNRSGNVTASFDCPGDNTFTGAGYYNRVSLNGSSLKMDNNQTGGWPDRNQDDNHNICIPFIVSNRGYGILFDDHWRGARISPLKSAVSYSSGSKNPVAYYFVGGGNAATVLDNYTALTGRQELPPYWSLGYISSRFGYNTEAEGREVVRRIRQECNIPLDGIVFDIYWQGNRNTYGMGNLEWYKPNFPNPEGMIADFKAQGVNTILITEPYFAKGSSNYSTVISRGYSADNDVSGMEWIGGGALLDATNPEALDWMWSYYRKHTASGVTGWWLDLGEPERHDADSHHQGGSVEQVHNEFGNLWVERVYRGLKEEFPEIRPMILPRAGTSGMQRYATFPWTGDITRSWEGLKVQIPSLLCAGMAGVGYLGSDVGGFSGSYDIPELYLRWIEFGVFSPVLRTHVTNTGGNSEPYHYPSILSDIRRFINLRYSYLPYTYTLAYENSAKGAPLARPMSYYTGDATLDDSYQYYWGRDMLIAPVVESRTSRSITFPEESTVWVDLNNLHDMYYGGQTITYQAPLATLPYFVRLGSIIPRYMADSYTSTSAIDRSDITLDCYTLANKGDRASGYMFDDNIHSTTTLADEAYSLLRFDIDCSNDFRLDISSEGKGYATEPTERSLTFNLPMANINGPLRLADGTPLQEVDTPEELALSDAAVYRNNGGGTKIHLRWNGAPTSLYAGTGITGLDDIIEPGNFSVSSEGGDIVCRYLLPGAAAHSHVELYDIYGHLVATASAGMGQAVNALRLQASTGVYIVQLIVNNRPTATAKIIHSKE